jgi:hypothetical protein
MNIDFSKIITYVLEAFSVACVISLMKNKTFDIMLIVNTTLIITASIMILDLYAGDILKYYRQGAGFGLGASQVMSGGGVGHNNSSCMIANCNSCLSTSAMNRNIHTNVKNTPYGPLRAPQPQNNSDNYNYLSSSEISSPYVFNSNVMENFMDDPEAIDYYKHFNFPTDKKVKKHNPNMKLSKNKNTKEHFVSFEDRYRLCPGENCNTKKARRHGKNKTPWCGCGNNCSKFDVCPVNIPTNAKNVHGSTGVNPPYPWQIGNLDANMGYVNSGVNQWNNGAPYCGRTPQDTCTVPQDPIINNPLEPMCVNNTLPCKMNEVPDNFGTLMDRIEKPLKYKECSNNIIIEKKNLKLEPQKQTLIQPTFVNNYKKLKCTLE